MQETMRSPIFRISYAVGMEIGLLVLLTPALSLALGTPPYLLCGFGVVFSLFTIPVNYFYNYAFERVLHQRGISLYGHGGVGLLHALLLEIVLLFASVPAFMHVLDVDFGQALPLGLLFAAVGAVTSLVLNRAFEA